MHVLREEMDAVSFRFVNKVGLNSRPNGYALLLGKLRLDGLSDGIPTCLGKRGYHLEKSPLNEALPPATDMTGYCNKPLDNETFIGFEFQRQGYVTMMSEDWDQGVFNWPSCRGFLKKPVDHYMR